MRIALAVSIVFLAAFTAHAALYSNDTDSVDIDYTGPAPIGAPDSNISSGSGTESSTSGGEATGGSNNSGNLWDASGVTVIVSTNGESGDSASGNVESLDSDGGDADGDSSAQSTSANSLALIDGEDILATLLGSQALSITGGAADGADSEVRLNGAKAREALKARGITQISIVNRFTSKFLSKKDFALSAVSDILQNENIEEVIMSLNSVTLSYKAQGRLFAVFPMTYPIILSVNPYGDTPETKVEVKFPWYSFFLQKYVTKASLVRDISEAIERLEFENTGSIDARGKFLTAITTVITSRTDTVEGTLR